MPRVYVFCIYGNASYFHRNIQYHDNFKKKMLTSEMYRNLLILQLDENLMFYYLSLNIKKNSRHRNDRKVKISLYQIDIINTEIFINMAKLNRDGINYPKKE